MIDAFFKAIIGGLNIDNFVETGTFQGETVAQVSMWFAELHPEFGQIEKLMITDARGVNPWNAYIAYPVFREASESSNFKIYSVDINPEFHRTAKEIFRTNPNIILECQSSEQFLRGLIDGKIIGDSDSPFFYLDAHWLKYWPLRDELKQILKLKRFAIAIDDFAVPGYPEFGYDVYGNNVCGWNYIKDLFKNREVSVYYPVRSNRDNRGWVLIISGYSRERLAFLGRLPLFRGKSVFGRVLGLAVICLKERGRPVARLIPPAISKRL